MATKSKKAASKSKKAATRSMKASQPQASKSSGGGSVDDGYVRLRTMLDSLEIGAVRYFLLAAAGSGRKQRYDELTAQLMPIIDWLWHVEDVDCPEGYVDCNGCCVPYPCPD
jgi:hypothetical protein